jgi:predicted nuclease of predicted toxin-antitoxin system
VKPFEFPLLTDENVGPEVVDGLRARGSDVRTAIEEGLAGRPDTEVLKRAAALGRVVVTHDLGFGRASLQSDVAFIGLVYLRPGHISSTFVLEIVDAVARSTWPVEPPFVLVAERRDGTIRVRIRNAPPW